MDGAKRQCTALPRDPEAVVISTDYHHPSRRTRINMLLRGQEYSSDVNDTDLYFNSSAELNTWAQTAADMRNSVLAYFPRALSSGDEITSNTNGSFLVDF